MSSGTPVRTSGPRCGTRATARTSSSRCATTGAGRDLFIGPATVKSHVSSVQAKLGLRDRVQVVVFAYESGFVEAGGRP